MPDFSGALSEVREGTVIAIEVTTSSKGELFPAGFNEWRKTIGCRVAAPAIGGRANRAVLALVAEKLGVAGASVSIISGASDSRKRILVTGIGRRDLLGRLDRIS